MSAEMSTELKIPDFWFDFYARMLPGATFAASIYLLRPGVVEWPPALKVVLLALGGYVAAFVTQPISSELCRLIHFTLCRLFAPGGDRLYIRKIERLLGVTERQILNKMHGETTCFVQLAVLSLVLAALEVPGVVESHLALTLLATAVFLAEAIDVGYRQLRRAKDLADVHGHATPSGAAGRI